MKENNNNNNSNNKERKKTDEIIQLHYNFKMRIIIVRLLINNLHN